MGFEVIFHFFEKPEGADDFNRDDLKSRTVKIGDVLEETQVERVAATILKEYSKDDIWIDKVEIFEWVKKPLKFAETKSGGVKIGAKTYNLGLNEIMKLAVDDRPKLIIATAEDQQRYAPPPPQAPPQQQTPPQQQAPPQQQSVQQQYPQQQYPQQQYHPPQQPQMGSTVPGYDPAPPPTAPQHMGSQTRLPQIQRTMYHADGTQTYAKSPQEAYAESAHHNNVIANRAPKQTSMAGLIYPNRVEVCDPPPELRSDAMGLGLTVGKRYEIKSERVHPNGRDYLYQITDDGGKERLVGWQYFRQMGGVLETTSFVDSQNALRDVTRVVDPVEAERRAPRPRLLYDDAPSASAPRLSYSSQGHPQIDNILQKMDAALERRRPQR